MTSEGALDDGSSVASNMTEESPESERGFPRLELLVITAIAYLASGLLLALPALFFGMGVDSLGQEFGWWAGDPNLNDDDYATGLPIGVLALLFASSVAGVVVVVAARRRHLQPAPPIAAGTGLLMLMYATVAAVTVGTGAVG